MCVCMCVCVRVCPDPSAQQSNCEIAADGCDPIYSVVGVS
jgi:hypothetical protein